MAKRFADTALSRKRWFRKLSLAHKSLWRFLCDECDEAGVWSIDEEVAEFYLGEPVPLDAFIDAVNGDGKTRVRRFGRGKLFLAGFVAFQYGELSEDCKPHQKVIRVLKKHDLFEEYTKGIHTLEEEEEDKEEEKEKKKGGVGENISPVVTPPRLPPSQYVHEAQPLDAADLDLCYQAWLETLAFYKAARAKVLPAEQLEIARAVQRQGNAKAVVYALRGARYEPKGETYDPAKFLKIGRVLDPDHFNRFMNLGVQAAHKEREGA